VQPQKKEKDVKIKVATEKDWAPNSHELPYFLTITAISWSPPHISCCLLFTTGIF